MHTSHASVWVANILFSLPLLILNPPQPPIVHHLTTAPSTALLVLTLSLVAHLSLYGPHSHLQGVLTV